MKLRVNKRIMTAAMSFVLGLSCFTIPKQEVSADESYPAVMPKSVSHRSSWSSDVYSVKFRHVNEAVPPLDKVPPGTSSDLNITFPEGTLEEDKEKIVQYKLVPLEDPRWDSLKQDLSHKDFPSYLDEKLLTLAGKLLADPTLAPGVEVNATVIHKLMSSMSRGYYIDDTELSADVKARLEQNTEKVRQLSSSFNSLEDVRLLGNPGIAFDTSKMKTDTATMQAYKFVGPITVKLTGVVEEANNKYSIISTDSSVKMFDSIGGTELNAIAAEGNQTFYLRFDKNRVYNNFKLTFSANPYFTQVGYYEAAPGVNALLCVNRKVTRTATLELGDVNSSGRIKVTKLLDGSTNPLAGCKFDVTTEDRTPVTTLVTGADGTVLSDLLPSGTYLVKEVENGHNYDLDPKEYKVTLTTNGAVEEIVSYSGKESGLLTVKVVDAVTGGYVPYSKLRLIRQDDNALVQELSVDETGILTKVKVPVGRYWLQEVATDSRWELVTTKKAVVLTEKGHELEVTLEKTPVRSKVKFITSNTLGEPLAAVKLDVYTADRDYLATVMTSANGQYELGLPAGNYLAMVKPYSGYSVDPNKEYAFKIYGTGETQIVEVKLDTAVGSIFFTTMDNYNNLVKNVEITVYNSENKELGKAFSDDYGKLSFSGLPEGELLTWKVSNVPYGYTSDSTLNHFKLETNEQGKHVTVTVINLLGGTDGTDTPTPNPNPDPGAVTPTNDWATDDTINPNGSSRVNDYTKTSGSSKKYKKTNSSREDETSDIVDADTLINLNDGDAVIDINSSAVPTTDVAYVYNQTQNATPGGMQYAVQGVLPNGAGQYQIQNQDQTQDQTQNVIVEPAEVSYVTVGGNPTVLPATADRIGWFDILGSLLLMASALSVMLWWKERRDKVYAR